MPFDFQIAVDSSQPHVLAGWWAETLGWVVEPSDEAFIRKMVAEGYATDDDTMTHNGMLVWRDGPPFATPTRRPTCPGRGSCFRWRPSPRR